MGKDSQARDQSEQRKERLEAASGIQEVGNAGAGGGRACEGGVV